MGQPLKSVISVLSIYDMSGFEVLCGVLIIFQIIGVTLHHLQDHKIVKDVPEEAEARGKRIYHKVQHVNRCLTLKTYCFSSLKRLQKNFNPFMANFLPSQKKGHIILLEELFSLRDQHQHCWKKSSSNCVRKNKISRSWERLRSLMLINVLLQTVYVT